jgi:hypothetical protein
MICYLPLRLRLVTGLEPIAYALIFAVVVIMGGCGDKPELPVMPAPVVAPAPKINDGESLADYKTRIKRDGEAAAWYAKQLADAETDAKIAKIKAQAAIDTEQAKNDARTDFLGQTKTWTGWAMGLLALAGVAAIIGGFIPFAAALGISAADGAIAFLGVAGLSILRYILLRYGLLVGDVAAWCAIGILIAAVAVVIGMIVRALYRGTLLKQASNLLAAGHTDAAVALESTAKGKTGQTIADKAWRKAQVVIAEAKVASVPLTPPGGGAS